MSNASEYLLAAVAVGSLGWGDEDDIENPTWEDVATKLAALANGEYPFVTLRLEAGHDSGERPPTLFAAQRDQGLNVYFRSADYSLNTGRDTHSVAEVTEIFRRFFERLELDPREDWGPD